MDPAALARLALLSAILAISASTTSVTSNTPVAGNDYVASTPASVTSPPSSVAQTYMVQAGDTLYSIAIKFNTTILALERANNITNPNTLAVGQKLIIPGQVAQNASTPSANVTAPPSTIQPALSGVGTPTQTKGPPSAVAQTYTVQAGDTLATIALQFGVTLADLQKVNNISNPNLISVGQRLIIPGAAVSEPLPDGIEIDPPDLREGKTIQIKITTPGITAVTGKFDQQTLHFNQFGDAWIALVGISRCTNYVGSVIVSLTLTDAQGNTTPVQTILRVNPTTFTTANLTLTPTMTALLDPAIEQAENNLVARTVAQYTPSQQWQNSFQMPLHIANPPVSSFFGERRSYNGGALDICGHEGQDFPQPKGTPVYAPADGTVVIATPFQVRGNVVFIDHGRGIFSGFFHLSEIDAKVGQQVQAGDKIGLVGTTGFSTGNHLHWSIWVNGIYVDPIQWTQEAMP